MTIVSATNDICQVLASHARRNLDGLADVGQLGSSPVKLMLRTTSTECPERGVAEAAKVSF